MLNTFFFFFESPAIYEVMWNRLQLTIWRIRITCWITTATDKHPEYVILISFHCKNGYENALCLPCYFLAFDRIDLQFALKYTK